MVTTDTSDRNRPGAASGRTRKAHRLDPSAKHWIQREREPRPQCWCARLRTADDAAATAAASVTSLEWW